MSDRLQFGVNINTRVPIIYPDSYTAQNMYEMAEEVESHLERQSGRGGPLLYAHAARGRVRFEEGWTPSPSSPRRTLR